MCVYINVHIMLAYVSVHASICMPLIDSQLEKIKKKMRGFHIFYSVYFLITIQQINIQCYILIIVMN